MNIVVIVTCFVDCVMLSLLIKVFFGFFYIPIVKHVELMFVKVFQISLCSVLILFFFTGCDD